MEEQFAFVVAIINIIFAIVCQHGASFTRI